MEETTPSEAIPAKPQFLRRGEDYESLYANNVQYQPSEWDLRITFGELDQDNHGAFIEQHTAISIPWLQAKITLYFLALQVGVFELAHGKILVPPAVIPPEPTPPTGDLQDNPLANQIYEYVKKMRQQFVESLP